MTALSLPIKSPAVSVVVLREMAAGGTGTQVLLVKRNKEPIRGFWAHISGGLENGERAWQAALRELREETSLVPRAFYSAGIVETFYALHDDSVNLLPVFVAIVSEQASVQLNHENAAYDWVASAQATKRLKLPNQRIMMAQVLSDYDAYGCKAWLPAPLI